MVLLYVQFLPLSSSCLKSLDKTILIGVVTERLCTHFELWNCSTRHDLIIYYHCSGFFWEERQVSISRCVSLMPFIHEQQCFYWILLLPLLYRFIVQHNSASSFHEDTLSTQQQFLSLNSFWTLKCCRCKSMDWFSSGFLAYWWSCVGATESVCRFSGFHFDGWRESRGTNYGHPHSRQHTLTEQPVHPHSNRCHWWCWHRFQPPLVSLHDKVCLRFQCTHKWKKMAFKVLHCLIVQSSWFYINWLWIWIWVAEMNSWKWLTIFSSYY